MDRGRSPSTGAHPHIRNSPSPSPHASFDPTNSVAPALQHTTSQFNPNFGQTTTQAYDINQTNFAQQPELFTGVDNKGGFGNTINPSFLDGDTTGVGENYLDPSLLESQNLMNPMATTQAHSPTPPHLLQPSTSPHHSPNMSQGTFHRPNHSRHTSLDPSSAAYPTQQGSEWGNMGFQGHRRAPSDTYSDVSSSAHPSPHMGTMQDFEQDNPSPFLSAQQDPALFDNVMSFGQFSLSDNRHAHQSPGQSPHVSPRLMPQQSLPAFTQADNYGLPIQQPMNMYNQQPQETFPALGVEVQDINGSQEHMSPPEIKFDFAPPSRQSSFEPPKPAPQHVDALSPPDRARSRNRMRERARSDPFTGQPSRSPSPGNGSLSPSSAKSRSPSPGKGSSRRSSTSNVPHRDYILDLADPSRPNSASSGGEGAGPKRTQKHPATFQCSLCPKRFTRAYNLRSHLRTHTDERPFVCSVCGKAFARQHDRKRHEGLHSGEKKFVCKGVLKDNNNWGCNRRFARADALGRHFRSEAGRICIRPLLEEEAQEKGWEQHQQIQQQNGMMGTMPPPSMPGMAMGPGYDQFAPMDPNMAPQISAPGPAYALPAALLAQYPALAGIQWDNLPQGPPEEYEGDLSGRSSFDASSGGEFEYEDEAQGQAAFGWASDYETNAR